MRKFGKFLRLRKKLTYNFVVSTNPNQTSFKHAAPVKYFYYVHDTHSIIWNGFIMNSGFGIVLHPEIRPAIYFETLMRLLIK